MKTLKRIARWCKRQGLALGLAVSAMMSTSGCGLAAKFVDKDTAQKSGVMVARADKKGNLTWVSIEDAGLYNPTKKQAEIAKKQQLAPVPPPPETLANENNDPAPPIKEVVELKTFVGQPAEVVIQDLPASSLPSKKFETDKPRHGTAEKQTPKRAGPPKPKPAPTGNAVLVAKTTIETAREKPADSPTPQASKEISTTDQQIAGWLIMSMTTRIQELEQERETLLSEKSEVAAKLITAAKTETANEKGMDMIEAQGYVLYGFGGWITLSLVALIAILVTTRYLYWKNKALVGRQQFDDICGANTQLQFTLDEKERRHKLQIEEVTGSLKRTNEAYTEAAADLKAQREASGGYIRKLEAAEKRNMAITKMLKQAGVEIFPITAHLRADLATQGLEILEEPPLYAELIFSRQSEQHPDPLNPCLDSRCGRNIKLKEMPNHIRTCPACRKAIAKELSDRGAKIREGSPIDELVTGVPAPSTAKVVPVDPKANTG